MKCWCLFYLEREFFHMQKQLSSVNGAFKTLKELLDPPNADCPAEVNPEALEGIVEEFRTQRYDGHTRQLTLLVKNLSSFFDVVSNIVRMIQDFEVSYSYCVLRSIAPQGPRFLP